MPHSEASCQHDRDRVRNWRKTNPERAKRNNRRAWKNWHAKHGHRRRVARLSKHEAAFFYASGLSIVSRYSPLTYIDARGRVHREDHLSAEELIRRWNKAQKKKAKKEPHP